MTRVAAIATDGVWTCSSCGAQFVAHPDEHMLVCPEIPLARRVQMNLELVALRKLETEPVAWDDDLTDGRMVQLAHLFPTLKCEELSFVDGWNVNDVIEFLKGGACALGASYHAARFLLMVWNTSTDWDRVIKDKPSRKVVPPQFNLARAMVRWDQHHRAAFNAWARDPWWP